MVLRKAKTRKTGMGITKRWWSSLTCKFAVKRLMKDTIAYQIWDDKSSRQSCSAVPCQIGGSGESGEQATESSGADEASMVSKRSGHERILKLLTQYSNRHQGRHLQDMY